MAAEPRMMPRHAPTLLRCAVLLVAVYLAVDVATPWLPGAFRFDPRQSVDATGRPSVPLAVPAPATRAERAPTVPPPGPLALRQPPGRPAGPRFVRVLHPPDSASSPTSADDA